MYTAAHSQDGKTIFYFDSTGNKYAATGGILRPLRFCEFMPCIFLFGEAWSSKQSPCQLARANAKPNGKRQLQKFTKPKWAQYSLAWRLNNPGLVHSISRFFSKQGSIGHLGQFNSNCYQKTVQQIIQKYHR